MKSYHVEVMSTIAFTYIGVEAMLKNTGNNYLVVALVHGLTIATLASAILFNKSHATHCPPTYLEDSAPWFPGTVLDAIPAFFLVIGHKTTRFLNRQVFVPLDRTTNWWGIERRVLHQSFC